MAALVWNSIVKKAFIGNRGIKHGNPTVLVTAGAPSTSGNAVGTLAWDKSSSDAYVCTVKSASSGDTWVQINA